MAHKSEIIETKGHPFVGVLWEVKGSKGNQYLVGMYESGVDCTCIAFRQCKHIKAVETKICADNN
jgi:hypothetical protein